MYQDHVMEMRYARGTSSPPIVGGSTIRWVGGALEGVDMDALIDHMLDITDEDVHGGADVGPVDAEDAPPSCSSCSLFEDVEGPGTAGQSEQSTRVSAADLRRIMMGGIRRIRAG
jgi:hypothetical protein